MALFSPPLSIHELPGGFQIRDSIVVSIAMIYSEVHQVTASFQKLPTREQGAKIAQAIVDALTEVFGED